MSSHASVQRRAEVRAHEKETRGAADKPSAEPRF